MPILETSVTTAELIYFRDMIDIRSGCLERDTLPTTRTYS